MNVTAEIHSTPSKSAPSTKYSQIVCLWPQPSLFLLAVAPIYGNAETLKLVISHLYQLHAIKLKETRNGRAK